MLTFCQLQWANVVFNTDCGVQKNVFFKAQPDWFYWVSDFTGFFG